MKLKFLLLPMLFALPAVSAVADNVKVGSGSYTTTFPGTDKAGRNALPNGGIAPRVSGKAATRPVPTSDWWTRLLSNPGDKTDNLFCYPLGLRASKDGLGIVYNFFKQAMVGFDPIHVSVGNINSITTVSDYTDWTVTMRWGTDSENFQATAGMGMPFVYFTKQSSQDVNITLGAGNGTIDGNVLVIDNCYNNSKFAVYAPSGSTWSQNGNTFTSNLNGKNYWSVAMLPNSTANAAEMAAKMKKYAFVFPADTKTEWNYNASNATVRVNYVVTPDVKEGNDRNVLLGLLPHQWGNLASDSPRPDFGSYTTIRGELKMLDGNSFTTSNVFNGILPTLPFVEKDGVNGFSTQELNRLMTETDNNTGLEDWTDSYNDGQLMNRIVQTGRIAKESGNQAEFQKALQIVKTRLEKWLTYEQGDVAFLLYYDKAWNTLIGYPGGYDSDGNVNDHHFHYGYFLNAAAFVAQNDPEWAKQWGGMVDMIVRDVANADRNDTMFPYLRNFNPYAGHSFANGLCTMPLGNDQESTSESMNFHTGLINWGIATGNTAMRDLGIYMYTTEASAIDEYWFDVNKRVLPSDWPCIMATRVFTNDYDAQTFWNNAVAGAGSYGIEVYPIQGGSFYLSRNLDYAKRFWEDFTKHVGVLDKVQDDNLWYDTMWEYLAFTDPQKALQLYNDYPQAPLKFGTSRAQTYHWLHAMATLGQFNSAITSDCPTAMAFTRDGNTTYVAHNFTSQPITVNFSDGYKLEVPAGVTATSAGTTTPTVTAPTVKLTSPANGTTVSKGTAIKLSAEASANEGYIQYVEFYNGNNLLKRCEAAPYTFDWTPAEAGTYNIYAKAGNSVGGVSTSETATVTVKGNTTGGSGCTFTSTEITDGSANLVNGYTVSFESVDGGVKITAKCNDEFVGLVGFVFDRTNGFQEHEMARQDGDIFTYTLTGYPEGKTITVAIKFAYAGGLFVTKNFDFVVGTDCTPSNVTYMLTDKDVKVYPRLAETQLHLDMPAGTNHVYVWNGGGQLMKKGNFGSNAVLDIHSWKAGVYFVRIENGNGIYVTKVQKK